MKRSNYCISNDEKSDRASKRTKGEELSISDIDEVFNFNHYWETQKANNDLNLRKELPTNTASNQVAQYVKSEVASKPRAFYYLDLDSELDMPRTDLIRDLRLMDDLIMRFR